MSRSADAAAVRPDAVMWIASCTKLLTSICALQCVEAGLISLDEPVSRILPELASPNIITHDPSAPNGFKLVPAKNHITLRHLLTHTSGVPYEWLSPLLGKWRKVQPKLPPAQAGLIRNMYNLPLVFEPGEGWTYGGGIDWAGELVARLHNTTLADYMQQHIFAPLDMTETTFQLHERPDMKARLMRSGLRMPDKSLAEYKHMVHRERVFDHSGGGGLWSTVPDFIKVLKDLISPSPRLLSASAIDSMLAKPQITHPGAIADLANNDLIVTANAAQVKAGDAMMNYGLGGMVWIKDSPVLTKGSLSWGGLPNLKWFVNRERGVAAVYATQVMPPGDPVNLRFSNEFFKEALAMAGPSKL